MPVILGKSKHLKPGSGIREIRYQNFEKNGIALAKSIAKDFGKLSQKWKPKKITLR